LVSGPRKRFIGLRILHVTPYFKPSWEAGGPPRSVYDLASRQVSAGHAVTVYTTDGFKRRLDVEVNRPLDVDGIRTYYFRNLSMYLAGNMNLPVPLKLPYVAWREIREFDVVHIHEHRTFLAAVVATLASRAGVPYIVQPHGSVPTMSRATLKEVFDFIAGNRIMYGASRIVATSTVESGFYRKVYPKLDAEAIVKVPNPVDIPHRPSRGLFRKKWGLEDARIILYLGRIHERKGLDILLRAFRDMDEDTVLVITGPDDHYLERLMGLIDELGIGERVLLTGPLYEMDKLEAYVDADVFVLPSASKYESFGNSAAEAIACGTPAVVTSSCGISEWMDPGDGIIARPSARDLRDAIIRVLKERDSFNPSAEKFDPESISETFEDIYLEVTHKASRH